MNRRKTTAVAVILGLVASGSAIAVGASGQGGASTITKAEALDASASEGVDMPSYDFNANPLGDAPGHEVADVADAAPNVPFSPIMGADLGTNVRVYVTDPDVQPDWQTVIITLDSAYGPIQIFERAIGLSQSAIDGLVVPGACTSCSEARSVVLAGGQPASVLTTPGSATTIFWRQNGFQIDVMGPDSTFSVDAAVKIANALSIL